MFDETMVSDRQAQVWLLVLLVFWSWWLPHHQFLLPVPTADIAITNLVSKSSSLERGEVLLILIWQLEIDLISFSSLHSGWVLLYVQRADIMKQDVGNKEPYQNE